MPVAAAQPQTMRKCSKCGTERILKGESKRIPRGWKRRREEELFCSNCWRGEYVLRAITVPVAEPLSGTWQELRAALAEMWRQTTAASNYIMTELYVRDVRRQLDDEKMPPMPRIYLYPEIRQRFPDLTPQSVASLEQAIQAKYRAKRYEVIWTSKASLANCRYPQPFPIHNQSWSLAFQEHPDKANPANKSLQPVISARIGDKRWELRLRSGFRYRRQLAALHKIADGSAPAGEAAFYRASDGQILCKMVAWLPRPTRKQCEEHTMTVRTGLDVLLAAVDPEGQRIWTVNADHVRRWIAEYEKKRRRLAEDQKAEQRPVPLFAHRRETMTEKQRHRMKSAVWEIARQLATFARRRKATKIEYDDSEHGFAGDGFPYAALRERIETNLDELGIRFTVLNASGEVPAKTQEPLTKE